MKNVSTRAAAGIVLVALLAAIGCQDSGRTKFTVSLHNASTQPVTAWLTKNGGPQEAEWLAPEDLSMSRAAAVGKVNGVIVPPGKTADIGPIAGKFNDDAIAVLRVYSGALDFDGLLATGVDSSLRVDVPLREGKSDLVVSPSAKLTVERADK